MHLEGQENKLFRLDTKESWWVNKIEIRAGVYSRTLCRLTVLFPSVHGIQMFVAAGFLLSRCNAATPQQVTCYLLNSLQPLRSFKYLQPLFIFAVRKKQTLRRLPPTPIDALRRRRTGSLFIEGGTKSANINRQAAALRLGTYCLRVTDQTAHSAR